jgi:predicted Zn-dependent protease
VLKDDSVQAIVDSIFHRIVSKNKLQRAPNQILVLNDPNPNAVSFGEGTFGVSVGLLGNIRFTDELAFILTHEVSHFELAHSLISLIQNYDSDYKKNVKNGMKKVLSDDDDMTQDDINKLRRIVYDNRKFKRHHELEADSLGINMSSRAGYSLMDSYQLFRTLDSVRYLEVGLGTDLFKPLHSIKYPFQEEWIKNRLNLYSNKTRLISEDSAQTHPDYEVRRTSLQRAITQINSNRQPVKLNNRWHTILRFQGVESAFHSKRADLTLALALEQLSFYPSNSYLVSIITKIFIDLIEGKKRESIPFLFLPAVIGDDEEQLRLVNNFLHHVSSIEMGEIAFNFLNSQSRFNPNKEEHYYLLWKICDLTARASVKNNIKVNYKEKFPKGKFHPLMKDGITLREALSTFQQPKKIN